MFQKLENATIIAVKYPGDLYAVFADPSQNSHLVIYRPTFTLPFHRKCGSTSMNLDPASTWSSLLTAVAWYYTIIGMSWCYFHPAACRVTVVSSIGGLSDRGVFGRFLTQALLVISQSLWCSLSTSNFIPILTRKPRNISTLFSLRMILSAMSYDSERHNPASWLVMSYNWRLLGISKILERITPSQAGWLCYITVYLSVKLISPGRSVTLNRYWLK